MAKGDFKFHSTLRVRWMECDAQGIVYYGAYTNYLEVGQAEYYRNLGFSIYKIAERGYFDTAVVKVTLEYKAPARLEDMLDIYMRVSSVGNTSITTDTEIYVQGTDKLLTVGQLVSVGYDASTGTTKPVPPDIRELIGNYERSGVVLALDSFPELAAAASLWAGAPVPDPEVML